MLKNDTAVVYQRDSLGKYSLHTNPVKMTFAKTYYNKDLPDLRSLFTFKMMSALRPQKTKEIFILSGNIDGTSGDTTYRKVTILICPK